MKVITREVIDKITFSRDEMEALKNLRNAIRICCDDYSDSCSCDGCPFSDCCCGGMEIRSFLNYIINSFGEENEDED